MSEQRYTVNVGGVVCYTKGQYAETTAGEMTTQDMRIALNRLADYENACFDIDGNEIIDIHAIHVLRGNMDAALRAQQERENPQPLTCVGCKREESYVTIGRNPIECIRCRRFHAEDHYEPKGEKE